MTSNPTVKSLQPANMESINNEQVENIKNNSFRFLHFPAMYANNTEKNITQR